MSSIGAIGSSTSALGTSNISMQDFLNILLTQLTYQDPLKPMDNKEFMAQLAQFTTLGQTQELNAKIDALLSTQASMQAVGLIGKSVTYSTPQGETTGTVSELSWAGSVPQLTLVDVPGQGTVKGIPLTQVTVIRSAQ